MDPHTVEDDGRGQLPSEIYVEARQQQPPVLVCAVRYSHVRSNRIFEIAITEGVAQIPAHVEKDDLGLTVTPREEIGFGHRQTSEEDSGSGQSTIIDMRHPFFATQLLVFDLIVQLLCMPSKFFDRCSPATICDKWRR
jgi:hypothetical protein